MADEYVGYLCNTEVYSYHDKKFGQKKHRI